MHWICYIEEGELIGDVVTRDDHSGVANAKANVYLTPPEVGPFPVDHHLLGDAHRETGHLQDLETHVPTFRRDAAVPASLLVGGGASR